MFLDLPGSYLVKRNNTNLVKLEIYNPAKGRDHKPMAFLAVNQKDFLFNVLLPFLDNLIWLSKKGKDYQDWKLILNIINQGKHFTEEGKELISLISLQMNNNRLSTNSVISHHHTVKEKSSSLILYKERVLKLLSTPSNYEVQPDGKILIKSLGTGSRAAGLYNFSLPFHRPGKCIFQVTHFFYIFLYPAANWRTGCKAQKPLSVVRDSKQRWYITSL